MRSCPHCRKPLQATDELARGWLRQQPSLKGATIKRFADEVGLNHHTVTNDHLPKLGVTWRELRDDERVRRIIGLRGLPVKELSELLGFGCSTDFQRWHNERYGKPYRRVRS